jgi:DGQHR domain-containing protein
VAKALDEGWTVLRKNKRTVTLAKEKSRPSLLESRVWTMLYRMGFPYLSGEGGSHLVWASGDPDSPTSQIDVVGVDDEVSLYIECKSYEAPRKDGDFAEKLAKHSSIRKRFAEAVGRVLPTGKKRHVASIIFTWNLVLRDGDIRRAQEENVVLLDEQALEYYEKLTAHIGIGARYQFLAEVFEGKKIEGLSIRVPALRTRMGRYSCYTFSVKPEWLLKVAYVSHRAKGKATDSDCYQRMISRSRLKRIGEYITKEGIFPTNIVVNIQRAKYLQFDRGKQEGDESGATFGWLTLSPSFGSAWVIDGQHRLFAYVGHPKASRSHLNVLAFEELPGERQAKFFVDINSEQKRVNKSLLVELAADLLWDAPHEADWLMALVSKIALVARDGADAGDVLESLLDRLAESPAGQARLERLRRRFAGTPCPPRGARVG